MCTCIRWPTTTFNEIKCQHSQNVRFYLLPPFRGTRLLSSWKWGSLAHSKSWHPIYNVHGVKFQKIQIFLWLFLGRCGTSKVPNISAKISAGSGHGLIKIGLAIPKLARRTEGCHKKHPSEYWVSPGDMRIVHLLKTPEYQPNSSTLCSVHRLSDGQTSVTQWLPTCVLCHQSCISLKFWQGSWNISWNTLCV